MFPRDQVGVDRFFLATLLIAILQSIYDFHLSILLVLSSLYILLDEYIGDVLIDQLNKNRFGQKSDCLTHLATAELLHRS